MKRSHAAHDTSSLHNPFGLAASTQQRKPPATSAPATPIYPVAAPAGLYQPPLPVVPPPPVPQASNPDVYRNYDGHQAASFIPGYPQPYVSSPMTLSQPPMQHIPMYHTQVPGIGPPQKRPRYESAPGVGVLPPAVMTTQPVAAAMPPLAFDPGRPPGAPLPQKPALTTANNTVMRSAGPPIPVKPQRSPQPSTSRSHEGFPPRPSSQHSRNGSSRPGHSRAEPLKERGGDRFRSRNYPKSQPRSFDGDSPSSSTAIQTESKGTFADFRLAALEIPDISWYWIAVKPSESSELVPHKHPREDDQDIEKEIKGKKPRADYEGEQKPVAEGEEKTAGVTEEPESSSKPKPLIARPSGTEETQQNVDDQAKTAKNAKSASTSEHSSVPAKRKAQSSPNPSLDNARLRIYFCSPLSQNTPSSRTAEHQVRPLAPPTACLPAKPAFDAFVPAPPSSAASETSKAASPPKEDESTVASDAASNGLSSAKDLAETQDDQPQESAPLPESPKTPKPAPPASSPDRISISYAQNTRRVVVNAATIEALRIFRNDGRIEIDIAFSEDASTPGIHLEALDPETDDFAVLPADAVRLDDPLLPARLVAPGDKPSRLTLVARLDLSHPLTEGRWLRSAEHNAWATLPALGLVASDEEDLKSKCGWFNKIQVVDPEALPTLRDIAKSWAQQHSHPASSASVAEFVDHLATDISSVIELVLCLIRGPDQSKHAHASKPASVSDLTLRAINAHAPFPAEQNYLSLATFAMFRLAIDNGLKAGLPRQEIEEQVASIVQQVPAVMLHRAMDAQYSRWLSTQKEMERRASRDPSRGPSSEPARADTKAKVEEVASNTADDHSEAKASSISKEGSAGEKADDSPSVSA